MLANGIIFRGMDFTILFSKQKYYTHGILFHKTFIFQFDKHYHV